MQDNTTDQKDTAAALDPDATGHDALDKRLSAGVLRGDSGTDIAQVWISAFLIAALGFLVYLGGFSIPLHGEDLRLFQDSTALHRIVTSPGALEMLPDAPLSAVGLGVVCSLSGGRVDALHGFSILLHLICAVLVFLIARRLLPKGTPEVLAMLAGLLFVAHPAMAGTVDYLIAYPVLQSSLFGLLALLLLLRGAGQPSFCVASLAGSVLCFALSFGSDAATLLLPLAGIGLLRLRAPAGEGGLKFARVAVPVLVLTLAVFWIAGRASGLLDAGAIAAGTGTRLSAFVGLCGNVLVSAVWPPYPALLPEAGGAIPGGLLIALLLAGVAAGYLSRPLLGQVALWVLVAAFSAACNADSGAVLTARYAYLPLAGLAILLPAGLQAIRIPVVYRVACGAAAVLVLALGFFSFQRTNQWRSPEAIWNAEAARHPESVEPWLALGRFQWAKVQAAPPDIREQENLYALAAEPWRSVLNREPGHPEAEKYLGMIAAEQGNLEEATGLLESASAREPENGQLALYLAFAREQQARTAGERESLYTALRAFRRAARLGPLPPEALTRYGMLAMGVGDMETGLPLLQKAAGDSPDTPLAETVKRFQAAAEQAQNLGKQAEAAMRENPTSSDGPVLRAEQSMLEGRVLEAFYALQQVMGHSPGQDNAWALLGYASARLSGSDNFLREWGESRAGKREAWQLLAARCAAGGVWDAAESYLRYGFERSTGALMPEIVLADIALQLRQPPRATAYLEAAQQAYPENPMPWLRLADLAIAAKETARARALLDGAEKRNAAPEDIKSRRDQLGEQGASPSTIERTVIR